MNNPNDGGSAFPTNGEFFTSGPQGLNPQSAWGMEGEKGMSRRDYFAIHATEEDIEWARGVLSANDMPADRINARWAFADAMLTKADGDPNEQH